MVDFLMSGNVPYVECMYLYMYIRVLYCTGTWLLGDAWAIPDLIIRTGTTEYYVSISRSVRSDLTISNWWTPSKDSLWGCAGQLVAIWIRGEWQWSLDGYWRGSYARLGLGDESSFAITSFRGKKWWGGGRLLRTLNSICRLSTIKQNRQPC